MFKNPGKKIALAAKIFAILGMAISIVCGLFNFVSSLISGISLMSNGSGNMFIDEATVVFVGIVFILGGFIVSLIILVGGCFLSWLGGLLLVSYGELTTDTKAIRDVVAGPEVKAAPASEDVPAGETSAE